MNVKSLGFATLLAVAVLIDPYAEHVWLVHYFKARGYSDLQIERSVFYYCPDSWREGFSYRARSPDGTPVQGGGCVFFFVVFATAESVGKK